MSKDTKAAFAKAMLRIKPLAPLSMVSSIPGSFYRSNHEPTFAMIYGMLENILGWHYSPEIRRSLKKILIKKQKKSNQSFNEVISESGYEPLIQQYVRINRLFLKPATISYADLWTQHLKHNDKRHFDGVRNYDWRLTKQISSAKSDIEKVEIMKQFGSNFPNYYQSPKRREYVFVEGEYIYDIEVAASFVPLLLEKVSDPVTAPFLGTSEGWIDIKIELS